MQVPSSDPKYKSIDLTRYQTVLVACSMIKSVIFAFMIKAKTASEIKLGQTSERRSFAFRWVFPIERRTSCKSAHQAMHLLSTRIVIRYI